ncbi:hypothetical protein F5051DRAFT_445528 [Lentinula edodes]|nr:hypothetical protein F5051DRAFT_445528 [Lentinula edodes]
MSTSRTTTTTIPQPRASTSARPADPPMPDVPADEDEDSIMREALARVERVKARKAEVARRRAEEEEAARKAAEEGSGRPTPSGTRCSRSGHSGAGGRGRVEVTKMKSKGKGKASAQPVGGDPNDGDDDDNDEDREPCERCKVKKIPCLEQAGKRSSVICKPCHDAKVRCSYSGRPYVVKKEGGTSPSGERLAVLESQMAQLLADNRALREANSKSHQYLRQLLRRQEDDHTRLISMDTRMGLMGMGEGPAMAGPSRRTTERRRPLKRRRVVEESDQEEEEEKEQEVEEDGEQEVEEEGRGMEVEGEGEGEAPAPTTAKTVASEKGKEKEVVE